MTGPNRTEVLIEGLKGRIFQLEQACARLERECNDHQNIICILVQKFGNPVIITPRDFEGMPHEGTLAISTDPETNAIMITFAAETSADTENDQTQIPQGSGEGEGE